jgi:hypothetical protein
MLNRIIRNIKIHLLCYKYDILGYKINSDGTIDVNGSVYLDNINLYYIPLNFNYVRGDFHVSDNNLTSLKGSPKKVGGYFYCYRNNLTSLEYSPIKVVGYIDVWNNPLVTLNGHNFENRLYCQDYHKLFRKTKLENIINNEWYNENYL